MTMNDTWGYKSYDTNFKSTETLLRNLIDIASKGGNYLLNIGPDSQRRRPRARGRAPARRWASGSRSTARPSTAPAHALRPGSRRLSAHREGQQGQAQVHPRWDWRSTTTPRQDLHRDLHLARRAASTSTSSPARSPAPICSPTHG
jgi:alpha-L-fucosidase